jgi:hypothetical protein
MSEKITVIEAEVIPTPSDAATAVRYANELLELWMLHLDKPLRMPIREPCTVQDTDQRIETRNHKDRTPV